MPDLLAECITQLDEYFYGERRTFSLETEQDGTPFRKRVWQELAEIPFGKTCSYLDIARKMGDKKSMRAVGTANGDNQLAIIVPCHRVIGADGTLTGYSGGLWRKQWLLEHERKMDYVAAGLFA